jgi:hypothetical protein
LIESRGAKSDSSPFVSRLELFTVHFPPSQALDVPPFSQLSALLLWPDLH